MQQDPVAVRQNPVDQPVSYNISPSAMGVHRLLQRVLCGANLMDEVLWVQETRGRQDRKYAAVQHTAGWAEEILQQVTADSPFPRPASSSHRADCLAWQSIRTPLPEHDTAHSTTAHIRRGSQPHSAACAMLGWACLTAQGQAHLAQAQLAQLSAAQARGKLLRERMRRRTKTASMLGLILASGDNTGSLDAGCNADVMPSEQADDDEFDEQVASRAGFKSPEVASSQPTARAYRRMSLVMNPAWEEGAPAAAIQRYHSVASVARAACGPDSGCTTTAEPKWPGQGLAVAPGLELSGKSNPSGPAVTLPLSLTVVPHALPPPPSLAKLKSEVNPEGTGTTPSAPTGVADLAWPPHHLPAHGTQPANDSTLRSAFQLSMEQPLVDTAAQAINVLHQDASRGPMRYHHEVGAPYMLQGGRSNMRSTEARLPVQDLPLPSPPSLSDTEQAGGAGALPPGLVLLRQPGVENIQVTVKAIMHPTTGEPGLLVVQQDTSAWAQMEALLADLVETQLNTAANLFPRHIVEYLSTNKSVSAPQQMAQLARQHQDVTLLFMDIVGFTALSKEVPPEAVMVFLNTLFALFDSLCDKHGETHSGARPGTVFKLGALGLGYYLDPQQLTHPPPSAARPAPVTAWHKVSQVVPCVCCRRDEGGDGWRVSRPEGRAALLRFAHRIHSTSSTSVSPAGSKYHAKAELELQVVIKHIIITQVRSCRAPLTSWLCCCSCYIVAGGILGLPNNKSGPCSQVQRRTPGCLTTSGVCCILQGVLDDGFTEVLQEHDPVDSASRVMAFAKDMMAASKTVMTPHNNQPVVIRIGMHTGNCVSGLVIWSLRYSFHADRPEDPKICRVRRHDERGVQDGAWSQHTLFSLSATAVFLQLHHESTCIPGRIQLSAATAWLLPHEPLRSTGGIQVKGQTPGSMWPVLLRRGPQAGPHTSRPTPMRLSQVSLLLPDSGSATPGGGDQPRGSHCLGSPNLSRASCALAVTQGLGGSSHSTGQAAARAAAATKAEKGITAAISQPLQKLRLGRQEDATAAEHLQALQDKATVAGTRAPAASRLATKTGAAAARWRTAVAELASAAASRSTAPELVLPRQLVSVIQEGRADRGPGTAGDSSPGLTTKHPAAAARQAEPATNDQSKHQPQPKLQNQPQPGDGQHVQPALPLPVWALDAPLPPSGPLPPHASALLPGPTPHLSPAEHVFGETSLKPPLNVDSSSPAVEATVHATPPSSQPAAPLEAQHSAQHSTALVSMMPTPKVCRELTAVPCPDPTKSVTATSATPQPADCQPGTAAAPSLAPRVPQPHQQQQQQLQQPSSTPAGPATLHRDRPALRRSTTSPNAGAKQPAVPSNVPSLLMFGPQRCTAKEPAPADSNSAALVRSAIQASSSGALRTQPMQRDGCDQPLRTPPGQQQDSCGGSVSFSGTNEVSTSGSATGLFNYAAGMKLLQQAQQQLGGERAASTPSGASAQLVNQGGTSARTGRRALKSSR
ncbi:hypothetical protein QJQ45_016875 [Haematococcus lacustris]|nr:hypothetical protein QJQ45_016875 [Haematococcus lacustris]